MAKKLTWQEAKKKMKKEEAELGKLYQQKTELQERIKKKEQSLREAEAEYILQLRSSSEKTDADLERFLLSVNQSHHGGGE